MNTVKVAKVALSLRLRIHPNTFERFLPASPVRVGEELAELVDQYARKQKLGYYPALEFFRDIENFDSELLDAVDHISWVATSLVREEVQLKLRPLFSSVRIEGIQSLAYTMPAVRPGQANVSQRLAMHYTPDAVKLDLTLSLLRKDTPREGLEKFAAHVVERWLKDSFATLDITSMHRVEENTKME